MKKAIVTYALLLSVNQIYSQVEDINIEVKDGIAGKNFITQNDIKVTEYIFPDKIHNVYVNQFNSHVTVQLYSLNENGYVNKNGKCVYYNLDNKEVKWVKNIDYSKSRLRQYDNTLIYNSVGNSYGLNVEDGKGLWKVNKNILHICPTGDIGISNSSYRLNSYKNVIEGIDLKSGKVLWKKELDWDYSWNDFFYVEDTILYIVAAGIHTINVKNGTGWDYDAVTGNKNYIPEMGFKEKRISYDAEKNVLRFNPPNKRLVRDIVSNILVDSCYLYFASKEKLSKINFLQGRIVWSTPLPDEYTSTSTITLNDGVINLVNHGYATLGNKYIEYGEPFIAGYFEKTGRKKYLVWDKDNGSMQGVLFRADTITILHKEKVKRYRISNGIKLLEKKLNPIVFGELEFFVGDQVFISKEDSVYGRLTLSDTTKSYVYAESGLVLEFDNNFNKSKIIDSKQFYVEYQNTFEFNFIEKDEKTLVVGKNNKVVAEISAPSKSKLFGKKLYYVDDNKLVEIDLVSIIDRVLDIDNFEFLAEL